jgi:hypothetical protein
MIWCFISSVLFQSHNKQAHGMEFTSSGGDMVDAFRMDVRLKITRAIPRVRKILSKLSRIEMENYHIIMTMEMYQIEPPWASICLIHTYETKYRYWYA